MANMYPAPWHTYDDELEFGPEHAGHTSICGWSFLLDDLYLPGQQAVDIGELGLDRRTQDERVEVAFAHRMVD
jgi:hypothetical protein